MPDAYAKFVVAIGSGGGNNRKNGLVVKWDGQVVGGRATANNDSSLTLTTKGYVDNAIAGTSNTGTFTPYVLNYDIDNPSLVSSTIAGRGTYTKQGDLVYIEAYIEVPENLYTYNIKIEGLPFSHSRDSVLYCSVGATNGLLIGNDPRVMMDYYYPMVWSDIINTDKNKAILEQTHHLVILISGTYKTNQTSQGE